MEYISREEAYPLAKKICDAIDSEDFQRLNFGMSILDWIDDIPAADVRPLVRGKWVNDHNGKYSASGDNFYCSICKDPSLRAFGKPARTNYCPNCGADMRISPTNCKNTVTTGEDREISNLRAWLKNGQK